MGHISLSRLSRPLLWLLWLVLLSLVLPVLLGVMTPLFLLIWVIGLYPTFTSREFRERMGVTPAGYLLWALLWPVLLVSMIVPALALALAVVLHFYGQVPPELLHVANDFLRRSPSVLRPLLPEPGLSLRDWAWFCVAAGAIGFSANCLYTVMDVPWRLKQIRQVRALPRSKARSAAIGLAEFEGVVRVTGADPVVSKPGAEKAQPFRLEDETGRVLVDPRDAAVRPPWVSGAALKLNEIEEGIRDGDRVYVIGNVQTREGRSADATDTDRLVIRPLAQSLVSSPVGRLLFPIGRQPADREAPNIFIVDKGRERDVILRLRMALWDFCATSAVYLASALWLVQAVWPFLTPSG